MIRRTRMRPRAGLMFFVCGLFAAAAPVALAQTTAEETGKETLARLIKEHGAQRASIERPLLAAYAQRLATLHDTLESRRDPAAAAVAAELAAVQTKLARGEEAAPAETKPAPGAPLAAPIELKGAKARTSGGASVLGNDDSPVQFAGKDSAAEWSLTKLPPGRYRLLWRIACEVGAGATVRLTIDGQPPRTLEVQPTTASGDAVLANLGEFTAATAPAWLRLEVLSLPGRPRKIGPSFSVGKIILIPPGVTMPGL
jgi:hypothetical protein